MKDEDRATADLAQAIKHITSNWALQLEILALKARLAKARFDAHRKAGFDIAHALHLCTKDIEL